MTKNINLYKKLYEEKKYEELIYKIENLEKVKSAQLLHILGICKLSKKILAIMINYLREKILEKHLKMKKILILE